MGEAILHVQTKYPSAESLRLVVGASLKRGSLCVPLPVVFEQTFELVLASLDGVEAVSGEAEVVEHAGDATWVRFLSARTAEDTRCVLVDTEVMSPAPLAAPETIANAARDTAPVDVSTIGDPPAMPRSLVDRRGTIEAPAIIVDEPPEEARRTVAAPAITRALAKRTAPDPVAAERGVPPIATPYLRTAAAARADRRVVVASLGVALASMLVAVAAVIWALSR
jgi:hypothetical protein